ncbi:hypothetical protein OF83DRAFT_600960 [Amylostereum chailletii]|nr:hypothetical protein OF83DRAFT_600960 [Amylostereum chailletii]
MISYFSSIFCSFLALFYVSITLHVTRSLSRHPACFHTSSQSFFPPSSVLHIPTQCPCSAHTQYFTLGESFPFMLDVACALMTISNPRTMISELSYAHGPWQAAACQQGSHNLGAADLQSLVLP